MGHLWRVTWKISRFEIIFLILLAILATGAELYLLRQLYDLRPPVDCAMGASVECFDRYRPFYDASAFAGQVLGGVGLLLPLVMGVILGSPLVAREVEHGTAQLAWSFAKSRRRWFAERALAVLILGTVLLVPVSLVSHLLEGAIDFTVDPAGSLQDYGIRGPSLLMRGLATLGIGLLAGTVLGRVLPALLVTALAGTIMFALAPVVTVMAQPLEVVGEPGDRRIISSLIAEQRWRGPDGTLVTQEAAFAAAPTGVDPYDWLDGTYTEVLIGIPGSRYVMVESTAAILYGMVGSLGLVGAGWVVSRRRPY